MSFSKQIRSGGGIIEFNFIRIFTVKGLKYFVMVVGNNSKSYLFQMEQRNGRWGILNDPKLPKWICDLEEELEQAILEEHKGAK